MLDSNSGRHYFWEVATNEVQWHKPFVMGMDEIDDADDLLRGTGIESHDYKILEAPVDKDVDELFEGTDDLAKKIQLASRAEAVPRRGMYSCNVLFAVVLTSVYVFPSGSGVPFLRRPRSRSALKSSRGRKTRKRRRTSLRRRSSLASALGLPRKRAGRAGRARR